MYTNQWRKKNTIDIFQMWYIVKKPGFIKGAKLEYRLNKNLNLKILLYLPFLNCFSKFVARDIKYNLIRSVNLKFNTNLRWWKQQ